MVENQFNNNKRNNHKLIKYNQLKLPKKFKKNFKQNHQTKD